MQRLMWVDQVYIYFMCHTRSALPNPKAQVRKKHLLHVVSTFQQLKVHFCEYS